MAIIKPNQFAGNHKVQKHGGKGHGRKGGFGGKSGGGKGAPAQGGGQWLFIPAGAQVNSFAPQKSFGQGGQRFGQQGGQRFGKGGKSFGKRAPIQQIQSLVKSFQAPAFGGGGKGGGKHGGGKHGGKGGGKHANQNPQHIKALDKLGKVEAERKVWIGGLTKETTRGQLHAHFKDTLKPQFFEIMSKGTACIAFKTAEDAQTAIDTFNGSELGGKDIQVDVWTQKEKKERTEGERPQKKQGNAVIKTSFLKGKKGNKPGEEAKKGNGKGKAASPMALKLKAVGHSLKVWIGGLSHDTKWKALKEHFVNNGCEVDLCDLMKPGTACCSFKTEDEVASAIGVMNGTELDDKTIEVDVWTKPERKEKGKKVVKEEA